MGVILETRDQGLEGCVNLPRPKWQVRGDDCLMSMAELAQARVHVHLGLWTPEPAPADTQEDVVPGRMLATAERLEGSSMGGSPACCLPERFLLCCLYSDPWV